MKILKKFWNYVKENTWLFVCQVLGVLNMIAYLLGNDIHKYTDGNLYNRTTTNESNRHLV